MSQESFTKSPLSRMGEPTRKSSKKGESVASQKEELPKSKMISLPKINHEEAMKKLTTIMNKSAKQQDDKIGGLRIQTKPKFHPQRMKTDNTLVDALPKPEGFTPGQVFAADSARNAKAELPPRKHRSGFEPGLVKQLEQSKSFMAAKTGTQNMPKGRNVSITQNASISFKDAAIPQNLPPRSGPAFKATASKGESGPPPTNNLQRVSPPRQRESRESMNRSLQKGKKNSIKATSFLPPDSFGKNRVNSVEKENLWSEQGGASQFMSFGKHLMKKLQKKLSIGSSLERDQPAEDKEQQEKGALGSHTCCHNHSPVSPAENPSLGATGTSTALTYELITARAHLKE